MNQYAKLEVVLLALNVSIFGGYKRTTEDDIVKAGGSLPKGDILTKGGKHIFPSEPMAIFHAKKKQLLNDISKMSVKSVGGSIAFSKADLAEVEKLVTDAKDEFENELVNFRQSYDSNLAAYVAAQTTPELANIITRSALNVDEAVNRFGFSYEMYEPTPVGVNSTIESMASSLTGRLYGEVSQVAYDTWDKSILPAGSDGSRYPRKIGQKTKRPIVTCREKLKKLSFLDGNIQNVVGLIDSVLAATQTAGYLEDTPGNACATRFVKLVELMMDADKFRAASTMVFGDLGAVDKLLGVAPKILPVELSKPEVETQPEAVVEPVVVKVDQLVVASQSQVKKAPVNNFF